MIFKVLFVTFLVKVGPIEGQTNIIGAFSLSSGDIVASLGRAWIPKTHNLSSCDSWSPLNIGISLVASQVEVPLKNLVLLN